jgi:hypothetical protein
MTRPSEQPLCGRVTGLGTSFDVWQTVLAALGRQSLPRLSNTALM